MLNLIFLPLMRNTIEAGMLAVKSVRLAQRIPDAAKRLFKNGLSVRAIAEATGLDEVTVRELQEELSEAV